MKAEGDARVVRTFDTQSEAIDAAKKVAKKDAEVIVHGRDGRARHTVSMSPADEAMMRVCKGIHAEDYENESGVRKVS